MASDFALFADFGVVIVPVGHHGITLEGFKSRHGKDHYYLSRYSLDSSRALLPGFFWVRAWKQVVPGITTSIQRMKFLESLKTSWTGIEGLSLVLDQKQGKLAKQGFYLYTSFDDPRLFNLSSPEHKSPEELYWKGGVINLESESDPFSHDWMEYLAFLSFNEVPAD